MGAAGGCTAVPRKSFFGGGAFGAGVPDRSQRRGRGWCEGVAPGHPPAAGSRPPPPTRRAPAEAEFGGPSPSAAHTRSACPSLDIQRRAAAGPGGAMPDPHVRRAGQAWKPSRGSNPPPQSLLQSCRPPRDLKPPPSPRHRAHLLHLPSTAAAPPAASPACVPGTSCPACAQGPRGRRPDPSAATAREQSTRRTPQSRAQPRPAAAGTASQPGATAAGG